MIEAELKESKKDLQGPTSKVVHFFGTIED